jgi:hypothetical protein
LVASSWYEDDGSLRGELAAHRVYARHPGGGWQLLGPADDDEMARLATVLERLGTARDDIQGGAVDSIAVAPPFGPYVFATKEASSDDGPSGEAFAWDVRNAERITLSDLLSAREMVDVMQLSWETGLEASGVPYGSVLELRAQEHRLSFREFDLHKLDDQLMLGLWVHHTARVYTWRQFELAVPLSAQLRAVSEQTTCPGGLALPVTTRQTRFDPDLAAREDVAEGDTALAAGDRERALRWWREALIFWAGSADPVAVSGDAAAPETARALARRMVAMASPQ